MDGRRDGGAVAVVDVDAEAEVDVVFDCGLS